MRIKLATIIAAAGCTLVSCSHGQLSTSEPSVIASSASSAPEHSSPAPVSADPVPSLFAAACGHPGAVVTVVDLPVTVHRKACDLTGVIVRYGPAGVIVPTPAGGSGAEYDASTGATSLDVDVDAKTGDVTIH